MRKIVLISGFIFPLLFSFIVDTNIIYWKKERKLSVSDFAGKPPANPVDKAWSKVGLDMPYSYRGNTLTWQCNCQFFKDGSWMVDASHGILAHEQGHFDIAEISARHVRKLFAGYKNQKIDFKILDQRLKDALAEMDAMEQLYDKETNHSMNIEAQKEWYKRIEDSLKALNSYSDALGVINFSN